MKIKIKLTTEQIMQLDALTDKVEEAFLNGRPGAIVAQVSPHNGEMTCMFVDNDDVRRAYEVLGVDFKNEARGKK